MNKVLEFERHSLECSECAARAPSPAIRGQYLSLAKMWRELASERRAFLKMSSPD